MTFAQIWAKLERGEPLTTRENQVFTDVVAQGINALLDINVR